MHIAEIAAARVGYSLVAKKNVAVLIDIRGADEHLGLVADSEAGLKRR